MRDLAREYGTPVYLCDEDDFRTRCRAFVDALPGGDVYYAAKAFLCLATARWASEEGLGLDVCTGGELAVALRAGVPPERIAFHGNNKSSARDHARARGRRGQVRGRLRARDHPARCRRPQPRCDRRRHGPGERRRRGAHARVHRHRARGPEVRVLPGRRSGGRRRRLRARVVVTAARRPALAHRVADLRRGGVRGVRPTAGGSALRHPRPTRRRAGRARPRRRVRDRVHVAGRPARRRPSSGRGCARSSRTSAPRPGSRCRGCRSSRGGRSPGRR